MSIEEQKKESCDDGRQDDSLLAHKKQDTGRQPESDNCFNSLSDTEEHFEFSPDMSDEPVDPHAGESGHGSKLSSDSFRSTSSASSLGNGGVCSNNNHPFPRDNHLRQSFTSRTTSWGPRSSRRSLNSHHRSKYTSANGHARQTLTCSSGNSPSSRRSSLSDEAISSNDPASLEDHVQYMTDKKIASLEQHVAALNQKAVVDDEKFARMKQENANLQSKVHLLEDQLRDIEVHTKERQKEEEKRTRDHMARLEKNKSWQSREMLDQISSLQHELIKAKDSASKSQVAMEKLREERCRLQELIMNKSSELEQLQEEVMRLKEAVRRYREEETVRDRVCRVLESELNDLKQFRSREALGCTDSNHTMSQSKLAEVELTLTNLRIDNQNLKEQNEELQAMLLNSRLEEGRHLLRSGDRGATSLADELHTLNEDQFDDILQLRNGLREQQEVNAELRRYIDGVLMNIIENYPQLLEVKQVQPKPM